VDYQVRAARITDIDRLVTLCADALGSADDSGPLVAPDLLRQLVYLPQASVLVAELRRTVIGAAVLALRPSVAAGGFVGTVDLLVCDPRHDVDAVADALIEEALRSARNKGCTRVEAGRPDDPAEQARWERRGFREAGRRLERPVATVGSGAHRP
jgi:GNAT superfamily N-acetyltransferase